MPQLQREGSFRGHINHYTLDEKFDNAANEVGPFDTATEAEIASNTRHSTLTLPAGIISWLDSFLAIDAYNDRLERESDHHPEDAGYTIA